MTLDSFAKIAAAAESIVTACGIIAAGIWTYFHFQRKRERFPRATVSHSTSNFPLDDGRTILRVAANVTNSGDVLLCLGHARTRVQHLFPVPQEIERLVRDDLDPFSSGECELPWPMLGAREWNVEQGLGEVEPGEAEVLCSDFVIPSGIEQVLLYTYVSNQSKPADEIGWSDSVVVSLKLELSHGANTNKTASN